MLTVYPRIKKPVAAKDKTAHKSNPKNTIEIPEFPCFFPIVLPRTALCLGPMDAESLEDHHKSPARTAGSP
jgi:hypothetical protein